MKERFILFFFFFQSGIWTTPGYAQGWGTTPSSIWETICGIFEPRPAVCLAKHLAHCTISSSQTSFFKNDFIFHFLLHLAENNWLFFTFIYVIFCSLALWCSGALCSGDHVWLRIKLGLVALQSMGFNPFTFSLIHLIATTNILSPTCPLSTWVSISHLFLTSLHC